MHPLTRISAILESMADGTTNMDEPNNPGLWFDLHCHVLPHMDDGCKTCEESARLLLESRKQGISGIAATPHYYPVESVEQFLERREQSFEELRAYLRQSELTVPDLCLGAEVAYRKGICREPLLDRLCYGQSEYLLLEMPFERWTSTVLREVWEICYVWGLTPVIAHIERYMKYQNRKTLAELFEMDVLIQMNAEFYLNRWTRGKARRLVTNGTVQVLGSDSHNMDRRLPNLGEAVNQMKADGLHAQLDELRQNSRDIFAAALQADWGTVKA